MQLAVLQFNLSPFRAWNSRAWLCQAEAQLNLRRVTSQLARYYHVISSLPINLMNELNDLLASPPSADAYDQLKATLLRRTMESESSWVTDVRLGSWLACGSWWETHLLVPKTPSLKSSSSSASLPTRP